MSAIAYTVWISLLVGFSAGVLAMYVAVRPFIRKPQVRKPVEFLDAEADREFLRDLHAARPKHSF